MAKDNPKNVTAEVNKLLDFIEAGGVDLSTSEAIIALGAAYLFHIALNYGETRASGIAADIFSSMLQSYTATMTAHRSKVTTH